MRSVKIIRCVLFILRDIFRIKPHLYRNLAICVSRTKRCPVMIRMVIQLLILMIFKRFIQVDHVSVRYIFKRKRKVIAARDFIKHRHALRKLIFVDPCRRRRHRDIYIPVSALRKVFYRGDVLVHLITHRRNLIKKIPIRTFCDTVVFGRSGHPDKHGLALYKHVPKRYLLIRIRLKTVHKRPVRKR